MKILILGGYGYVGRFLAGHILKMTGHDLIISGRNLKKAEDFAGELASPRVTARYADAADTPSINAALKGADYLLIASPTADYAGAAIRCAIDAGVDCLDIQYSSKKLSALYSAKDEITRAGLCFMTEAGYHPGLPSAMVRFAAAKLDTVESAQAAGYINMGGIPYTEAANELVDGFKNYRAQIYRDGSWTDSSTYNMHKFDFGPGTGLRNCYSMFFEELKDLPVMYPSLKNTGFYISSSNLVLDYFVYPLVIYSLKLFPDQKPGPLGKLLWWAMMRSKPPYKVILIVEARGISNGKKAEVTATIGHASGYELTAIPVVAFLMQYDKVRSPGVHMMGHLAEPVQLFEDMKTMGAKISFKCHFMQ